MASTRKLFIWMALATLIGRVWCEEGVYAEGEGGTLAPTSVAVEPALTDEQVTEAIGRGVEYLLACRDEKTKRWDKVFDAPGTAYYGGETCLVLFALLHVGQNLSLIHI